MDSEAVLLISRAIIGFTFMLSSLSKLKNIAAFQGSISRFRIVPPRLVKALSIFLLIAEGLVALMMLLGGETLMFGFGVGLLLLIIFTFVLTLGLLTNVRNECSCFGNQSHGFSFVDVIRNLFLAAFAFGGVIVASLNSTKVTSISISESLSAILLGCVLSLCLINLSQIAARLGVAS